MKLIVLSDLHLVLPGEDLGGLDPLARLEAAIARINRTHRDANLVVLAGDVTDRSRTMAYETLRSALTALNVPWVVTLGNHDNRDVFARVFGPEHLDRDGFAQSAHRFGDQVVLVLDSLKKGPSDTGWGHREGQLSAAQLVWLTEELARAEGRPVTLVMHHPVFQVSPTFDPTLMERPEPFLEQLAAYPDVRAVIAGHVHMTTTTLWRGIPFVTISGGHATNREEFGAEPPRTRLAGPAQMAVVLSGPERTTVHFDAYVDDHPELNG